MNFVCDIEKGDFLNELKVDRCQSIQMAFWPPALPEPTSVRKLAELINEPRSLHRTNEETPQTNVFQSIRRTNEETPRTNVFQSIRRTNEETHRTDMFQSIRRTNEETHRTNVFQSIRRTNEFQSVYRTKRETYVSNQRGL